MFGVVVIIFIFSSAQFSADSSCTKDEKSLDVLKSSWIDEDLALLGSRKEVGYVFGSNIRKRRIYQKGSFLARAWSGLRFGASI